MDATARRRDGQSRPYRPGRIPEASIRFHDLRHTYVSLLIQTGEPLAHVRDSSGTRRPDPQRFMEGFTSWEIASKENKWLLGNRSRWRNKVCVDFADHICRDRDPETLAQVDPRRGFAANLIGIGSVAEVYD